MLLDSTNCEQNYPLAYYFYHIPCPPICWKVNNPFICHPATSINITYIVFICLTHPLSFFRISLPRPETAGMSTLLTATQLLLQNYNTKSFDVDIYLLVCYKSLLIINLNIVLTTDIPTTLWYATQHSNQHGLHGRPRVHWQIHLIVCCMKV